MGEPKSRLGKSQHVSAAIMIAAILFPCCFAPRAEAQDISVDDSPVIAESGVGDSVTDQQDSQPSPDNSGKSRTKPRRGALVGLPVPISSPAVGSGVTLMGGYIFPLRKSDTVSPPSIIGGGWAGTDNGTRAWAAGAELYFNSGRYHVRTGFAHGDLNYWFYGTGNAAGNAGIKFGLNQTGDAFVGEVSRKFFWDLFIGPRLWLATTTLAPQRAGQENPYLPPFNKTFDMRSVGFTMERETTPNRFYPESGTMFEFGGDYFSKEIGSTFSFQSYRLIFNAYHSFDERQVLAYNLYGCSTGGDAPFFGECIFGFMNELRGYPAGRYIDKKMLATQAEYRLELPWRFGVVAFGGLGEVAPSVSKFNAENVLPSIGFGPRFSLSTKYHVNIRADFAWGKTGNTFGMGLGEAF
jgi:hypothetical protein